MLCWDRLPAQTQPSPTGRTALGAAALQGGRALLADCRNQHLTIVAGDGLARRLNIAQSACLARRSGWSSLTLRPSIALCTGWSGRSNLTTLPLGSLRTCCARRPHLTPFASRTLRARGALLACFPLRAGRSGRSRRSLGAGRPLQAGHALRAGGAGRPLLPFETTRQQNRSRECSGDPQSAHANAPGLKGRRRGEAARPSPAAPSETGHTDCCSAHRR